MEYLMLNINWLDIYNNLWHLLLAFALAIPIGLDRQQSSRNFGLRTFPLVAVVSCGFMMVGTSVINTTDGEARIFQGIITGIGFIGGGAVLRTKIQFPERHRQQVSGILEP